MKFSIESLHSFVLIAPSIISRVYMGHSVVLW